MKVYEDKESGLWKVGTNGKPIHNSEKEAKAAALNSIVEKIWDLQKKRNKATGK